MDLEDLMPPYLTMTLACWADSSPCRDMGRKLRRLLTFLWKEKVWSFDFVFNVRARTKKFLDDDNLTSILLSFSPSQEGPKEGRQEGRPKEGCPKEDRQEDRSQEEDHQGQEGQEVISFLFD